MRTRSVFSSAPKGLFLSMLAAALSCLSPSLHAQTKAPSPSTKAPFVALATVAPVKAPPASSYPARIVSPATLNVTSRIEGAVEAVLFKEGQTVKAGDLLYRLDPIRYQAALESARATLADAQATFEWAASQYARDKALYAANALSKEAFEESRKTERTGRAAVQAAHAQVTLAEDNLQHTEIRASFTGRAGVSAYPPGSWVTAGNQTLTTIVQTDPVRVRFAVSLRDALEHFGSIESMLKHARVSIALADGSAFAGQYPLLFIDNAAASDSDTVDAYAEVPNPQGALVVQSTVSASVVNADPAKRFLAIPAGAVQHDAASAWVWVVDEKMSAHRRDITVGQVKGDRQIVYGGLTEGERVVSKGTHKVTENTVVRTE